MARGGRSPATPSLPLLPLLYWSCLLLLLMLLLGLVQAVSENEPRPEVPVFGCGGELSGESGYLGSEGYPGLYPPNRDCLWRITVPPGHRVLLSLQHLDLEKAPLCRYDALTLHDGATPAAPRLARYCGTAPPGSVHSTGPALLLRMSTDGENAGTGFLASFTAERPAQPGKSRRGSVCGGRLRGPSGSFYSPNWPHSDYPTGITCSWHISGPPGKVVSLRFVKFDVERDASCRRDHVSVFDGRELDEGRRLGRLCGDEPPEPLLSSGSELFVQFVSDHGTTADGFEAFYSFRARASNSTGKTTTARTTTAKTTTAKTTTSRTTATARITTAASSPPTTTSTVTAPTATTRRNRVSSVNPRSSPCRKKCLRRGTLESNFCANDFVLVGRVVNLRRYAKGSVLAVDVLRALRSGRLQLARSAERTTAKLRVACRTCPLVRQGMSYVFMGTVGPDRVGTLSPHGLALPYSAKLQRTLAHLHARRKC
ncbi:unnamed protein product [Lampetra planeri]